MKLKLPGSEFDEVEWRFDIVKPGHIFWRPPVKKEAIPLYKEIELNVPNRLSLTVLDLTRFGPPGKIQKSGSAGNVSVGVSLLTRVSVRVLKHGNKVLVDDKTPRKLFAKHIGNLMKNILNIPYGLQISARDHGFHHCGLGSTAVMEYTIAWAINILFGSPLTDKDLIKTVALNYVEESPKKGYVIPGLSTGASGWVAKKGGGIIVSPYFDIITHTKLPEWKVVIGILPSQARGVAFSKIEIPIIKKAMHWDRFQSSKVCYWILTEFIPAMKNGDLEKMGETMWDILLTYTSGIPLLIMHSKLSKLDFVKILTELKNHGIELAFMSSCSPNITVITRNKEKIAKKILENYGLKVVNTKINNEGLKITKLVPW